MACGSPLGKCMQPNIHTHHWTCWRSSILQLTTSACKSLSFRLGLFQQIWNVPSPTPPNSHPRFTEKLSTQRYRQGASNAKACVNPKSGKLVAAGRHGLWGIHGFLKVGRKGSLGFRDTLMCKKGRLSKASQQSANGFVRESPHQRIFS